MKQMNRNSWVALGVSILVVSFFLFGGSIMNFFNGGPAAVEVGVNEDPNMSQNELIISDALVGAGEEATLGSRLTVHYVGRFPNGGTFDTSLDNGVPISFVLGAREVIEGWDKGLLGMRAGGRRTLIVPPGLAYGETGFGPIPGNATLIFDVELLSVVKPQ